MNRYLAIALFLGVAAPSLAQDAPLPARVAAQKMTLPPGFKATLFAGEPDLVQPIAFCFDDRGRLWVAECMSYPKWETDPAKGRDRITIFEDTDGDGVHDKRTVFANNIANISGIQYGFGGVWVCATPNLLFIPIKEEPVGQAFLPAEGDKDKGADKNVRPTKTVPAGPPQIVLDGWDIKARHNVFNSPTWGPDGWLYGCNGILSNSKVGAPGTPDKDRIQMNCGVWRYHPTKKKFEVVAHGTTNPWGLDFDEHGEMFVTNCVIDHLWHIVPGGHYERMFGNDLNPHVYKLMPSICDHKHWGGGSWTSSRAPLSPRGRGAGGEGAGLEKYKIHSEAGGGHAHSGCMIYLGDNWPQRYRGGVFMCNIHGNRINHDILERNGSTYIARHAKDFMHANDPWFRGLAIHYGPDGGVYVADWTDTGECHNYEVADKSNGRIFKITYDKLEPWKDDLAKKSDRNLGIDVTLSDEWTARHARRILQERAANGKVSDEVVSSFERILLAQTAWKKTRLRCLWALHSIGRLSEKTLLRVFDDVDEHIRAWAIRLAFEEASELEKGDAKKKYWDALLDRLEREPSPFVRLHLLSVLQRITPEKRDCVEYYVARHSDTNDPYLPFMLWYALEPCVREPRCRFLPNLMLHCETPLVNSLVARHLASLPAKQAEFDEMVRWLRIDHPHQQRDRLHGIQEGLSGRRQIAMPKQWKETYPILIESPLPEVRERALALAVQFGDERAFTLLRKIVPDRAAPMKERESALQTLLFQQKADLVPILHDLLSDDALRGQAIRGLAAFDDAKTPKLLVQGYGKWNPDERSDAIQTLASRGAFALALLDAIDAKAIPRGDVNSYTIRQLQALKHPDLPARLTKVIGEVRPASADKAKLMAKYKADLTPANLKKANLANGRALYNKACASCHRLFGEGGDIGPDLTGSQRTNLDYILENVLDPSAIVPREYQVTVVVTTTGRTLSGLVKKESDAALTLQTANDLIVLPKSEIESRTPTKVSMMPEGAFEQMKLEEVRDLVAYLASPSQVALKK